MSHDRGERRQDDAKNKRHNVGAEVPQGRLAQLLARHKKIHSHRTYTPTQMKCVSGLFTRHSVITRKPRAMTCQPAATQRLGYVSTRPPHILRDSSAGRSMSTAIGDHINQAGHRSEPVILPAQISVDMLRSSLCYSYASALQEKCAYVSTACMPFYYGPFIIVYYKRTV